MAITVLGLIIGVAFALIMTPVYEARLVMVPSAEKQPSSPLGGLLGDIGGIAGISGGFSLGSS